MELELELLRLVVARTNTNEGMGDVVGYKRAPRSMSSIYIQDLLLMSNYFPKSGRADPHILDLLSSYQLSFSYAPVGQWLKVRRPLGAASALQIPTRARTDSE